MENAWGVVCTCSSTVTVTDSEIFQFTVRDEAAATVRDSIIEQCSLEFFDPPVTAVSIEGLYRGHVDEWSLQGPGGESYGFNLTVQNSDINNWVVRTHGTDLALSNSSLGTLRMAQDTQATVDNSTIGHFWVWWYTGVITFENSIMEDWYETRWCDFWIKGSVAIGGGTIIQPANGPWTDATIHREYPVSVTVDNAPAPNANLSLETPDGSTMWTGTTDINGTAIFTLTFTETNYLDTWTLSASGNGFYIDTAIVITSTTPIALSSTFGDFDGDCKVTVTDIMKVASRWGASRDNPDPDSNPNTPNYDHIYDADDDSDIDIVDIMKVAGHWRDTRGP